MVYAPSRAFVVTNWSLNTDEVYEKHKDKIRFMAYGEELCPSTERKHHQVFLYLWKQSSTGVRALKKISNWFGNGAHVEPMRGSFRDNEEYCSKEGSYHKLGEEPKQGNRGDIIENKDMIMSGNLHVEDLMLTDPTHYHMYGRTYEKIQAIRNRQIYRKEMTTAIWYYGPTGVGKSHKAFENYDPKTYYIKDLKTHWWDGYNGHEIVIMNEYRNELTFSYLLQLIDKWPMTVPVRNKESVPFIAKHIIFTSSDHPKDSYRNIDLERFKQLERRLEIVELKKD